MSDNKTKRDKLIERFGGRKNGTGETYLFDWDNIKYVARIAIGLITIIFLLSAKIAFFKGLPPRLDNVESTQKSLEKKVDKNTIVIEMVHEKISDIQENVRTLVLRDK